MDRDGEYARQSTCANSVFAIQLFKTGMRACVLYIVHKQCILIQIIIIIIIIIMFIYPPNNDVIKSITCYKIVRTRNWRVVLIHSTRTLHSVLTLNERNIFLSMYFSYRLMKCTDRICL
jgi:hypothetical protein